MIPPYFLDVKPEHFILDCCASPGSKTCQIIEMMNLQSSLPDGCLIANDIEPIRCKTLVHQVTRFPIAQTLVTCFPAQIFPELTKFDRILCDVICFGDGTIRKNPDAAGKWSVKSGVGLHPIQKSILLRCLQLLKVGGKLVYSTCSLNPIEDEAVISSAVLETKENIVILNMNNVFPELKRSPGLTHWKVFNENTILETPDNDRYTQSMFPNPQCQNLQNCMRFYPHQNDSGGFFVAVLEKKNDFDFPVYQKNLSKWKEPPIIPLHEINPNICEEIISSFGFPQTFPKENLFIRDEKAVKNIYYLSRSLTEIVQQNQSEKLRAQSAGVRLFS
jgi:16S rRNA C967 or C1407 C5-methylase (RsmB/RsmF family)